jgi:hypothetical protein
MNNTATHMILLTTLEHVWLKNLHVHVMHAFILRYIFLTDRIVTNFIKPCGLWHESSPGVG